MVDVVLDCWCSEMCYAVFCVSFSIKSMADLLYSREIERKTKPNRARQPITNHTEWSVIEQMKWKWKYGEKRAKKLNQNNLEKYDNNSKTRDKNCYLTLFFQRNWKNKFKLATPFTFHLINEAASICNFFFSSLNYVMFVILIIMLKVII